MRRESSLGAAREWARVYRDSRPQLKHVDRASPAWDYSVVPLDENGWNGFIGRADPVRHFGIEWAFELPDQFPHSTNPANHAALGDYERTDLRDHIEKELQA